MTWLSRANRVERPHFASVRHLRSAAVAGALGLLCFSADGAARAHIILISDGGPNTPKDWQVYSDSIGDPQKPTPCGDPQPSVPTNAVMTVHPGDTVTISWTEAVAHSGHFRIALAPLSPGVVDAGVLPDPVVTQYTNSTDNEAVTVQTLSSGAGIGSSSTIVLADNLYPHCISGDPCDAGPVTGPGQNYSYTLTIPNVPCTNCTLQLVQFMSYHPPDPSFFYHHCATTTILAADGGAAEDDAGTGSSTGAGGSGSASATGMETTTSTGASSGSENSGGSNGTGAATGEQTAGSGGNSNGSAASGTSGHGSGGCGIATGAASVPAAALALSFIFARRRRRSRAASSGDVK